MDPGVRTPLIDLFRRGEAPLDIRLLAAEGALAPRGHEQVALLILLSDDSDRQVAHQASATLGALPDDVLRVFLARSEVPAEVRALFSARGLDTAAGAGVGVVEDLADASTEAEGQEAAEQPSSEARVLSSLPIIERMKIAMKGSREQRAQLIRDSNKLVAAAVLSSPKLTESEIEAFAKMANVSDEVLRIIGANRSWLKNYRVVLGLTRNPKTPPAMSMQLLHRLNERDVKMLSMDRNVPEAVRLAARRIVVKSLR